MIAWTKVRQKELVAGKRRFIVQRTGYYVIYKSPRGFVAYLVDHPACWLCRGFRAQHRTLKGAVASVERHVRKHSRSHGKVVDRDKIASTSPAAFNHARGSDADADRCDACVGPMSDTGDVVLCRFCFNQLSKHAAPKPLSTALTDLHRFCTERGANNAHTAVVHPDFVTAMQAAARVQAYAVVAAEISERMLALSDETEKGAQ